MNKTLRHIFTVLCIALLLWPSAALAANAEQMISQTNDQLNAAVAQAHFLTDTSPNQSLTDFANEAPAFESALARAYAGFENAAKATTDRSLRSYADQLAQATKGMAAAVPSMASALVAQDASMLSTAIGNLNSSVRAYSSAADSYNAYVQGNSRSAPPLVGNFIFFLVVSAGLLVACVVIWARTEVPDGDALAKRSKSLRRDLALTSLLPAVASVSAYIWYRYMADHGGDYPLLYIPILIGFIALAAMFIRYRQGIRGATLAAGPVPPGELEPGEPPEDPGQPESGETLEVPSHE